MNTSPVAPRPKGESNPGDSPDTRRDFLIGFSSAIVTTVVAAFQPVVTRYAALNIDPLAFCAGSVVCAAAFMVVVLGWRGELAALADRRYLGRLFMLSMAGTVMTVLTLTYGLRQIDAVAAVILLESEPIYSLILATIFVGERPTIRQVVATAVILAGIGSVFAGGRAFTPYDAALLILLTPLFWQASHVISLGVMPPLSPVCLTGARYIYAAFVLILLMFCVDRRALTELADPRALAIVGCTGLFIYCAGSLSWYAAINRLSLAWTTAFVIPGVPILSFLFAIAFLGERPTIREIIGISVAVLGVIALVVGADAHRKSAAEAVHQPIA